jgi:hypothetical protein
MAEGTLHWGTVSHGTLRTQDLLQSFSETLEQYRPGNPLVIEARRALEDWDSETDSIIRNAAAADLLNEIQDRLNEVAADFGGYFGAHEGDGSDFGFWQHNNEEGSE